MPFECMLCGRWTLQASHGMPLLCIRRCPTEHQLYALSPFALLAPRPSEKDNDMRTAPTSSFVFKPSSSSATTLLTGEVWPTFFRLFVVFLVSWIIGVSGGVSYALVSDEWMLIVVDRIFTDKRI